MPWITLSNLYAVFDDVDNATQITGVFQRIAVDDDDVGQFSFGDRAKLVLFLQYNGGPARRGHDGFHRRESDLFHQEMHFACRGIVVWIGAASSAVGIAPQADSAKLRVINTMILFIISTPSVLHSGIASDSWILVILAVQLGAVDNFIEFVRRL